MVYEDKRGLHRRISQYFNSDQQNDLHNKIFIRMSSKHTIIIVCQDWQKSKWTQALKLENPWKRSDASFRSFGKKEWCQFQSQHKTWTQKIHNLSIQDSNFEERQYFKPIVPSILLWIVQNLQDNYNIEGWGCWYINKIHQWNKTMIEISKICDSKRQCFTIFSNLHNNGW